MSQRRTHCVSEAAPVVRVRDEPFFVLSHPPHHAFLPGPRSRLLDALRLSLYASPHSLAVSATLISASQPSLQPSRPAGFVSGRKPPGIRPDPPYLPFRPLFHLTFRPLRETSIGKAWNPISPSSSCTLSQRLRTVFQSSPVRFSLDRGSTSPTPLSLENMLTPCGLSSWPTSQGRIA